MAKTFKCTGVTQNGEIYYLFNGKSIKTQSLLNKYLNNAEKQNLLSAYNKIIIETTETFTSGDNAYIWPNGRITAFEFLVVNGVIQTKHDTKPEQQKNKKTIKKDISFSYQEKYAVGLNPAVKHLPKNVDAQKFIEKIKNIKFDYLNCVILNRQITNPENNNVYYVEMMLYNPKYTYDAYNVIIGSAHAKSLQTRHINKRDIPITHDTIINWQQKPETISKKLSNFFIKQK